MFEWIMAVIAVITLVAVLIDQQYKIDQEDWDFREEGDER